MALIEKVNELNNRILQGDVLGAFDDLYHDDIEMQENEGEVRKGKAANRAYEENFVTSVEAWNGAEVLAVAANEETQVTIVEWFMDFTFKGGQRAARKQVSVQRWQDGKIISEKFYYGA